MADEEGIISVQKEEKPVIKQPVFRGYALYTYNANRPNNSQLSEVHEETSDSSVADFLRKEATSNHDFSLSLLSTDLTGEQDTELRTFIAKRLTKGTVYSGSGNIASIDNVLPNSTSQCYYCLLRGDQESEDDQEDIISLGRYLSKDFVVCFVTDANIKLELFQQELDSYSSELLPELMTPIESLDVKEQFGHLQNWYEENVLYLCRCADLLGQDLSIAIQCGLVGMELKIDSADLRKKKDIQMFIDACSTMNSTNFTSTKVIEDISTFLPEFVSLTIDDTGCHFNIQESTKFCQDWANTMLCGDVNDPIFLREVIENYKLRVNHDLNTLKRLFREAETDHYALYRSYQFLLKCGNGPVLLHNTKQEALAMSSTESLDILSVLEARIYRKK